MNDDGHFRPPCLGAKPVTGRQLGYLGETPGFAPPPRDGFALVGPPLLRHVQIELEADLTSGIAGISLTPWRRPKPRASASRSSSSPRATTRCHWRRCATTSR